jgi:hypothetical protein
MSIDNHDPDLDSHNLDLDYNNPDLESHALDLDSHNTDMKGVPKLHQLTLNNNNFKDIHRDLFAGTIQFLTIYF